MVSKLLSKVLHQQLDLHWLLLSILLYVQCKIFSQFIVNFWMRTELSLGSGFFLLESLFNSTFKTSGKYNTF